MQENEQNISPIKQRILYFVKSLGISKRNFYGNTGISRGTLESKSGITEEILAKFIVKYPEVSPDWILNGAGEMLRDGTVLKDEPETARSTRKPVFKGIPLIPAAAAARILTGRSLPVTNYKCDYYNIPIFKGAEFLIAVNGDSMKPRYLSGDIVACKRVKFDTFFQWNRVYLINSTQGVLLKHILPASDDAHIICSSDNVKYLDFVMPRAEIISLSLVLGVLRAE
jgi:phage repressor protein C with HTH and peptisase S24 domain